MYIYVCVCVCIYSTYLLLLPTREGQKTKPIKVINLIPLWMTGDKPQQTLLKYIMICLSELSSQ